MIGLEAALAIIAQELSPLEATSIPLESGLGRILREDIHACKDQPPFDASAMDGYACLGADLRKLPSILTQVGISQAGARYPKELKSGQAVRIFTGAPLPHGADTIIIQENTTRAKGQITIKPGKANPNHIRSKGYDYKTGQLMLKSGTCLSARDLMLAASLNKSSLLVALKPKIAIIATGDELVAPGEIPTPDQIVSSVPYGLKPMFESIGCEVTLFGIANDNVGDLLDKFLGCEAYDCIITIGGASVGDYDFLHAALSQHGVSTLFQKLALRPGKPLTFGMKGSQAYLGLPGNPASALLCARLVGYPIIDHLTKGSFDGHGFENAQLLSDVDANGSRLHFMRGILSYDELGQAFVHPSKSQDSSLQSTLALANCLIVRPTHGSALYKGETTQIMKIDF